MKELLVLEDGSRLLKKRLQNELIDSLEGFNCCTNFEIQILILKGSGNPNMKCSIEFATAFFSAIFSAYCLYFIEGAKSAAASQGMIAEK